MSFLLQQYLLPVIIFSVVWSLYVLRTNKKFSLWIKNHWFFSLSKTYKLSVYLYLMGVTLLLLATLDLRGPEKVIQSETSSQRTLILIDTSASMFVEDVRPNRFEKALLLVKHYVKRSIGQKIAVAVFSDAQKIIVPFTDDVDLIEARVDSLQNLNLRTGGTALSLAVQEGVQYIKTTQGEAIGNILIFTDAEETDGGMKLTIPEDISVGVVGVGTRRGGPVPIRNARGVFIGNKKHQGELVISKLDEKFIESIGKDIEYFKYWIATSYTLPTEEILQFFSRSQQIKKSKNNYRIRPVEAYKIMIPAMLLLILAYVLKLRKPFVLLLILMPIGTQAQPLGNLRAMPNQPQLGQEEEEKEPEKSEETLKLEQKLAEGELDEQGTLYLANKLLDDGFEKDSAKLYEEVLGKEITPETLKHHFNYGVALSSKGTERRKEGIQKFKHVLDYLDKNEIKNKPEDIEQLAKLNLLKLFKGGGDGKGDSRTKDKSKSDESQKGKDQNKDQNKGEEGDQNQSENQNQDGDKKNDDDQNGKGDEKPPEKDMKRNDGDDIKETAENKQKRKKKLPALLKQLMSDDNKLQGKMIDMKTTKRKASDQKDW